MQGNTTRLNSGWEYNEDLEQGVIMRRVEICRKGFYGATECNLPKELCIGLFHGFFLSGNTDEGIYPYAIVELPAGTVRMVETHQMKFLDKPPKSEGE